MVKRIKTPPPPDDEPRYLTVVHPYPLNANLELHADRRTLALWLACCAGKDVLFAMFHKPASPGMVVIEVDRDFDSFDNLLGLHTWSEFLKKPSEEQKDKVSKVFYCTYNTGRLVEKNGWKRVSIEEHWFQGWSPNNAIIRHPYPRTRHCEVPSEAKTGAPMCRPLPQRSFPVPPPAPAPPVGSAGWLANRSANPTASPAPSTTRRTAAVAPTDTASVTSSTSTSRSTRSFPPPPPSAPSTAPSSSVMANYRARTNNDGAWKRGPPSVASVASSRAPSTVGGGGGGSSVWSSRGAPSVASSRAPSTVGGGGGGSSVWSSRGAPSVASSRAPSTAGGGGGSSVWSSRGGAPTRGPPGLGSAQSQTSQSGRFDWSEDVERFERDNPPPMRSTVPTDPGYGRRQPYDPEGPVEPSQSYEYTEEDRPRASRIAAMSDIFSDEDHPVAPPSGRGGTRPRDLEDPDYNPWEDAPPIGQPDEEEQIRDPEAPWEGYAAPRLEPPTKVQKRGEWTCPQHGPLCNPGICKERAEVERAERMREQREKWDEEKREWEARRERNKMRKERKAAAVSDDEHDSNDDDSDTDRGSPPPPPEPDQGNWDISWDATRRAADTQSTVSSARPAWNSDAESDDDDYDHDGPSVPSVPSSRITNPSVKSSSSRTSNSTSTSSAAPPRNSRPASVVSQPAWDTRSVAESVPESVWPSESGYSRTPSAASATGSDTGGPRSASASISGSSSASRRRPPITPSTTSATSAGFPTYADTHWGDPIAKALASDASKKASKSARKRKNKARTVQAQVEAEVRAKQVNEVEAELGVQLPPGGPGSEWGDPDETW